MNKKRGCESVTNRKVGSVKWHRNYHDHEWQKKMSSYEQIEEYADAHWV